MRYIVLDSFKAQTTQGERYIHAGQIINLQDDKAGKLISAGRIKSIMDMLKEDYQGLITWLKQYDVTGADIRETMPGINIAIQSAIEELDRAMIEADIQGFTGAAEKIKKLYLEAVEKLEG